MQVCLKLRMSVSENIRVIKPEPRSCHITFAGTDLLSDTPFNRATVLVRMVVMILRLATSGMNLKMPAHVLELLTIFLTAA